jgi:hypothetical protein
MYIKIISNLYLGNSSKYSHNKCISDSQIHRYLRNITCDKECELLILNGNIFDCYKTKKATLKKQLYTLQKNALIFAETINEINTNPKIIYIHGEHDNIVKLRGNIIIHDVFSSYVYCINNYKFHFMQNYDMKSNNVKLIQNILPSIKKTSCFRICKIRKKNKICSITNDIDNDILLKYIYDSAYVINPIYNIKEYVIQLDIDNLKSLI